MRIILFLLISLMAFNSFSAGKFYYFYDKFPQKTVYEEIKAKFPDISYSVKASSEGKMNYGPFFDGTVHLVPVGPLELWGFAIAGKKTFVVYHVEPGGVAEKRGIKKWDQIIGISKQPFSQAHDGGTNTGTEGPIKELGDALERAQAVGGIKLLTERNGRKKILSIKIEKLGRFSKTYPAKCRKTILLSKQVANELAEGVDTNRFGCSSLIGLSLLMHGDPKHVDAIKQYAIKSLPRQDQIAYDTTKMYISNELHRSSWFHAFSLLYLVEYFWATGDTKVVPAIQSLAYAVGEQHQNPFGGSGHHIHGIGNYWDITFGATGALNICAMALAEKAGFKVDKPAYKRYWLSMNNTVQKAIDGDDSYKFTIDPNRFYGAEYFTKVWSGSSPSMGESAFNTGAAALALGNAPAMDNSKELVQKFTEHLTLLPYSHGYIHTTSGLGNFVTLLSLSCFDRLGFQKTLQYRKHWLTLSRFPSGQWYYFHPKRARGGWGGDGYLGLESCQYFQTSVMLNGHRRRLLTHGNKRRNWLSGTSTKETTAYLKRYHSFYAADLLNKAKASYGKKDYLAAYDYAKKIRDNYSRTSSVQTASAILAKLNQRLGKKKLDYLLTKREIERYVKFIDIDHEDHSHYGDSVRPKLLEYIAEKYKKHPMSKKVKALVSEEFGARKLKSN